MKRAFIITSVFLGLLFLHAHAVQTDSRVIIFQNLQNLIMSYNNYPQGSKSNPYPAYSYGPLANNHQWFGGWVLGSSLYYVSASRACFIDAGPYFCTKDYPCPGYVYHEMVNNGIWIGGWVNYNDGVLFERAQDPSGAGSAVIPPQDNAGCGSGSNTEDEDNETNGCGCGSENFTINMGAGSIDRVVYDFLTWRFLLYIEISPFTFLRLLNG